MRLPNTRSRAPPSRAFPGDEGACHCGAVVLELRLSDGLNTARRCDCSLCRRRGAIAVSAPLDGEAILQGAENLNLYQFGSHTAKHWFYKICGIYTHHQRSSNPNEYGVNVAILDGINPRDLGAVPWVDGAITPRTASPNRALHQGAGGQGSSGPPWRPAAGSEHPHFRRRRPSPPAHGSERGQSLR